MFIDVPNRFTVAPMTRTSADEHGVPTAIMGDYYERFAKGGFGLVITEGVYTDDRAAQGYVNQPGIINAAQADAWRNIVERIHASGSKAIMQLMHAGAQMQHSNFVDQPIAPSTVQPKGEPLSLYGDVPGWLEPKEASLSDLEHALNGFVASAKRAEEIGFDGVELHAANGYLLNEFLSTHFNQREDEFGGSLDKRIAFVERVVRAVRSAVSDNFAVGIRIGQITVTDNDYQWPEGEAAAVKLVRILADAGVDFIHTTDTSVARKPFADGSDKTLADIVAAETNVGLIINGGIDETNYADYAAKFPNALLALGKKALANPDFPERFKAGDTLVDLDFQMLLPKATLENEWKWRAEQGVE
ncbi:NADH:flavin oxidoreductase [Pseudidiomarina marina]|uniref:NADH:flavin oxidoreductase n=1 Tax=Pseudidiomarina marina TaxID=502366 RepID=A0A432YKK5_9GAMM|nr:NADH:flavin oxidoreductase [Pseudidiomarina marina]RUO61428.1 NADH:flavin oxidoreductase [Pseudidiomarina marina]